MFTKEIQKRIKKWTSSQYDTATRKEIQDLFNSGSEKELVDRFYQDLDFGTGGMRGVMGAGTNRMNLYTVGKVAEGLSEYLKKLSSDRQKTVVIAYDSRHYSKEFALRFAEILAFDGIQSYIFASIQPTPLLSYAIREIKTHSGVMITASHNPREYNGIKIYGPDGGQVLPPLETEIIDSIQNVQEVYRISESEARKKGLIQYVPESIEESYYQKILSLQFNPGVISKNPVGIVFTPLHGTGNIPVREILKRSGLPNLWVVKEQETPDPDFPSIEYPNPEEEGTLDLACSLAREKNADLVLATDPDADRLAIAVKNNKQEWIQLTGNQLGTLLCHYILDQSTKQNLLNKQSLIVKSIVSTDLIFDIVSKFGVHIEEVLTGFKYIAERLKIYHDQEKKVHRDYVFGFEESCGYGIGDIARDKDAVSASLLVVEMACFCKSNGITLLDYLEEIYREYGYYQEDLESLTLKGKEGKETIDHLLESFRQNPPKEISDSLVERIRDIKKAEIIHCLENRKETLNFPQSNVLTYYLKNGSKVTLRPSGTEPKIKFYYSVQKKLKEKNQSLSEMKDELLHPLEQLKSAWMKEVKSRSSIP